MRLLAPFTPRIGGGGMITAVADYPGQALFWQLVGFDPATGLEGEALGSLKWDHTRADPAGLSVNPYLAPTSPGIADIWYSGDFNGVTGYTNGPYWDGSGWQLYRVFQNLHFPNDASSIKKITLIVIASGNFEDTANYEIRQNITPGNGGVLVASGTSPYTLFDTGIRFYGYIIYLVTLTAVNIPLAPGKYYIAAWLNASNIGSWTSVMTTSGANAIGITDDNDAYIDDPTYSGSFQLASSIPYGESLRKFAFGINGETLRVRDRVKVRWADA